MTIHLLNPEWRTTFCGKDPREVGLSTSTLALSTCKDCFSAYTYVMSLQSESTDVWTLFGETQ